MKKKIFFLFLCAVCSSAQAMEMGEPSEKGKGEEIPKSLAEETAESLFGELESGEEKKVAALKEQALKKIQVMLESGQKSFEQVINANIPLELKELIASRNNLVAAQFVLNKDLSLDSKKWVALRNHVAATTFIFNNNIPLDAKEDLAKQSGYAAIQFAKEYSITKEIAKIITLELLKQEDFDLAVLDWEGFRKQDPNGEHNRVLLARALFNEYYVQFGAKKIPEEPEIKSYAQLEQPTIMLLNYPFPKIIYNAKWPLEVMTILWSIKKIRDRLFIARVDPLEVDPGIGVQLRGGGKFYYVFNKDLNRDTIHALTMRAKKLQRLANDISDPGMKQYLKNILKRLIEDLDYLERRKTEG